MLKLLHVVQKRLSPLTVVMLCCVLMSAQQSNQPQASQSQANLPEASQSTSSATGNDAQRAAQAKKQSHHIFWVIPNYRSDESGAAFKPLTPKSKFKVALDDSFDPSAFLVAGVFAGTNMAQRQYASFGNGPAGFAQYYGGAFADQAIGNFMTEALFPIALHQDPRYFTKGKGGFFRRAGYALSREVVTLGDNGREQFNTSEMVGNFVAAGISNVYYPAADRTFSNTANKWGQQIALDAFFNVLKEYWPDMRHKILHQD
jgi:hypothetical protein